MTILFKKKYKNLRLSFFVISICAFLLNNFFIPSEIFARNLTTVLNLPQPGALVSMSPQYAPSLVKGLTINRNNPFDFNFIIDTGDGHVNNDEFRKESIKLIVTVQIVIISVAELNMY